MNIRPLLTLLLFVIWLFAGSPVVSFVEAQAPAEVADLFSKEGSVQGKIAGSDWKEVETGTVFKVGDSIRVSVEGRAGISFRTGNYLRLSNNAVLHFDLGAQGGTDLALEQGKSYFFSKEPVGYPQIRTPQVSAAIRGTEFVIAVDAKQTSIAVIDGAVKAFNNHGEVDLQKGQLALTELGKAPVLQVLVNPDDAVQWVLHYPRLGSLEQVDQSKLSASEKKAWQSIDRSQALLSAGRVDDARTELSAIKQEKGVVGAVARAQDAIILLTQNKKDEARALAVDARTQAPESLSACVAHSFILQADFDLVQARDELNACLQQHPNNSYLKARLAEIELGLGNIEEAEAFIGPNPEGSYALSLLGFINLFKNEIDLANELFLKAQAQEPGAALPHLGYALGLMRQGHSDLAMPEFQKAVSLEPQVALYRSYLGKAFFEEEQEGAALHEYEIALERDSKDPTPWLYRAFSNLSRNQVVAALRDVEASIERNENRAVYRSRLLLDQDRGVRSAGLAKVFNELGFPEVARLEAIKSINSDYSNYSAHRLLADSSETVFLADAGFSERRISTLLAPLSLNLFRGSAGDASLNEYDALFDKAETRSGISGLYDSRDDIYSGTAQTSGRGETYGYAFGLDAGFADGTRHKNYLRDYRLSAIGQYEVTWKDRLILEGDGQFREVKDEGGSPQDSEFRNGTIGLGYNRRLSAGNTIIAQAALRRGEFDSRDHIVDDAIIELLGNNADLEIAEDLLLRDETDEDVTSVRTGAQYLHSSSWVSLVGGFQFYNQDADRDQNALVIDDEAGIFQGLDRRFRSHGDNNVSSEDFYLYSTVHGTSWLDINLGATHSTVEIEKREITPFTQGTIVQSRLNPKFGVTVYPLSELTLRAAYFETLHKSALEDQDSIEPTLVGGLNQRFTDFSGTEARNLGFGADYKIPGIAYFGAEWTKRHLIGSAAGADINFQFDLVNGTESQGVITGDNFEEHVNQDVVHGYWYQVICSRAVFTTDYQFTQQVDTDPDNYQELENNSLGFGLRYFDPSGVFAFTKTTWREQHRDQSFFLDDGIENFWVVDAGLGYRLPKRHGVLSLEFLNIGNEEFNYDQSLGFEPFIKDEFSVLLRFATNF